MLLSSLMDPRFIMVNTKAESLDLLVSQLLDRMYEHKQIELSRAEVESALADRMSLGGTTYPTGIAIPHARLDLFNNILIGIARPEHPILHNNTEVRVAILILTSKTTSNLYLNCLSSILRLSRSREFMDTLLSAGSPEQLLDAIRSRDIEIKSELTVENIMSSPVFTVNVDTSIRDAINLFCEKGYSYLPVVDSSGNLLGELTATEILRLGIPNYAQIVGNSNHLKAFEPLEELLAREEILTAGDAMDLPTHVFAQDTSIVEAVFTFTKAKRRHVPVLDGTKLVGIVSYMDIIRKVLRA